MDNKKSGTTTKEADIPYEQLCAEFVSEVRSQFATLTGEISARNAIVQENDAYIYGDLLSRSLDIPVGHDYTAVNWLRRTVEIHRTQFLGRGFSVVSTYDTTDESTATDEDKPRIKIENNKAKEDAEKRRTLIDAIIRDNGGYTFFSQLAENSSAVGDSVVKAWYDEDEGKYHLQQVEAIENCYALWKRDNFREYDAFAYVNQISRQQAVREYDVPADVATSPLGQPLAVLSTNTTVNYISTQPMVTIMEVTGLVNGWCTKNKILYRCNIGDENEINVIIVGNKVYSIIDEPKYLPHYYILPNKKVRRRPWSLPDITTAAIHINLSFIETLSDWRTLAAKSNFPKFKYFGFSPGTQLPKPKSRQVEGIPLVEGQDIQPLMMPNSSGLGENDFRSQMSELKEEFVREVGISRQLFDMPDEKSDSNQSNITAMKSISDLTEAKRQLWTPILENMFIDALTTLSYYDDAIKELIPADEDWHLKVMWPSILNKDDPAYQTMLLNRFNANTMSIQSYLEAQGETKEELDRIKDEMGDPVTAAIHGRIVSQLAEQEITPPNQPPQPKVNVNLRGDLTPQQEGNLASTHGFLEGPFEPSIGPQGNQGLTAGENYDNAGFLTGNPYQGGMPIYKNEQGQPANPAPQTPTPSQQPEAITPPGAPTGTSPMSQPGSGAPPTKPQGKLNQKNQRKGG